MENKKMSITLLPHTPFVKDGKFDKEEAINYSAKLAGECYTPEGWNKLKDEDLEKSQKRADFTLALEHSTPYEHVGIGMEINNLPKILAMVLNNEKQCSTSEKSARYTKIDPESDPNISVEEGLLYQKWLDIFTVKIKEEYGNVHNDIKIRKLAQENARYLVTVFASTKMIHTVPWVQLNRIVSFMEKYSEKENQTNFDKRLIESFKEFTNCMDSMNILDEKAMSNRKDRSLSFFDDKKVDDEFGYSYSTNYKGSFAQLAQAHRHRTLSYGIELLENQEFFVPPILEGDDVLLPMWLEDIESVAFANPQGELVSINERGTYENFILKTKERLCAAAQLEIANQTKVTLEKYKESLEAKKHPLAKDIKQYSKGARCTFPDYDCAKSCGFAEAVNLERRI